MQMVKGLIALLFVGAVVFAIGALNDMKSQAKYAATMNGATATNPARIAKRPPAGPAPNPANQVRQKARHANL